MFVFAEMDLIYIYKLEVLHCMWCRKMILMRATVLAETRELSCLG